MSGDLILASASAARQRLLADAGVAAACVPAAIDEAALKAALRQDGAAPRDVADHLAEAKALKISRRHPDGLVLGADQVLVCEGEILDKPASRAAAREQLLRLRGRTHTLLSAAVIAQEGAAVWRHVGEAELAMRAFSDGFLESYLAAEGDAVLESVGGYRLEARGVQLFSRVRGDFFTILGLPLLETLDFLRVRGICEA